MEFSVVCKHSGPAQFSPDGRYIAFVVEHRLIVRRVTEQRFDIVQIFVCLDAVQHIEWSKDSMYILCAMFKRSVVQVWHLEDPTWACKIDEGSAGLEAACWAPDGRHILTTAEFQLRITIWSLISQQTYYIKYPKHSGHGASFTKDGAYLAVLERADCKDYVSVFACQSWEMVKHFAVETSDAVDLAWAPDGRALCVWDSALDCRVVVYTPDGRKLAALTPYDDGLGVKTVSWSPSSQLLAVGLYDETVRLVNNVTWKVLAEYSHSTTLDPGLKSLYVETQSAPVLDAHRSTGEAHEPQRRYDVRSLPFALPSIRPDVDKPNPRVGVGLLAFSADSRYLATRNDNMPCCVFIWDNARIKLTAVLVQQNPVRAFAWHPRHDVLAIASGSSCAYLWSPEGASCVPVPLEAPFSVLGLRWAEDGRTLAVLDKDGLCVCRAQSWML